MSEPYYLSQGHELDAPSFLRALAEEMPKFPGGWGGVADDLRRLASSFDERDFVAYCPTEGEYDEAHASPTIYLVPIPVIREARQRVKQANAHWDEVTLEIERLALQSFGPRHSWHVGQEEQVRQSKGKAHKARTEEVNRIAASILDAEGVRTIAQRDVISEVLFGD